MESILMVCLGNICRSPMAEGILRARAASAGLPLQVDSAGTGGWHAGESPDERAIAAARRHGVDISSLVARKFTRSDFRRFSRIYVMDRENHGDVLLMAESDDERQKVDMILNLIHPGKNMPVPDPYYGGGEGFNKVFRMLDQACEHIIATLR